MTVVLHFHAIAKKKTANDFPRIELIYTQDELVELLTTYKSKHDTIGLLYSIAAYHLIEADYDSINMEYVPFLIRNIECMRKHSLKDYYELQLIVLYYYTKSDKIFKDYAIAKSEEIIKISKKNKWDKIQLETYLFLFDIYENSLYGENQEEIKNILNDFSKYEREISQSGVIYNFLKGKLYFKEKNFQKSSEHFLNTFKTCKTINYNTMALTSILYLCQIKRILKEYQSGLNYGREAIKISKNIHNLSLKRWMNQELALIYGEGFGLYKIANQHWFNYFSITSKVENIKTHSQKVPELQLKLVEEKLNSENERLAFINNLINQKLKSEKKITTLTYYIAFLLFLISVIVYAWARQYRKTVERNKFMLIHEAQEVERQKISQDLHDSTGSYVFAIKSLLTNNIPNFSTINHYLDIIYNHIRQTSHILSSKDVAEVGLVESCLDFIRLFKNKVTIEFQMQGKEYKFSKSYTILIYRMIQELILNAIKHSNASHIFITFFFNKDTFVINFEDNGDGFDTNKTYDGLGLTTIRQNLSILQGKLELSSGNHGTTYWIEFTANKKTLRGKK